MMSIESANRYEELEKNLPLQIKSLIVPVKFILGGILYNSLPPEIKNDVLTIQHNGLNIDFSSPGDSRFYKERSFAISHVDEKDKFSTNYNACSGLFYTGIRKSDKKRVCFLSHQNPEKILLSRDDFLYSLNQTLLNFLNSVDNLSISGGYFGGNNLLYEENINFLRNSVSIHNLPFEKLTPPSTSNISGEAYVQCNNSKFIWLTPK